MSDPIYVLNKSSLQLPKLVEKSARGLADLLPGEVGKIPAAIVEQSRVQGWIQAGRLKVLSEEDFYKQFDVSEHEEENISFKAKFKAEKQDDAVIVVPGVDELPEVDDIPEPSVSNLDGAVTVRAPEDDEPLTGDEPLPGRAGDPTEVDPQEIHAKRLNDDGSLSDLNEEKEEKTEETEGTGPSKKMRKLPDIEPAAVQDEESEEDLDKSTLSSVADDEPLPGRAGDLTLAGNDKPLTDIETSSEAVTTEAVLKEKAWRCQVKMIEACSDPEVILAVAEGTSRKSVKKACAERIEALT